MIAMFHRLTINKSRLVIALLIALCLVVAQVNAASMHCRSDPIVFLSDGSHFQISASVQTSVDNLNGIHYQLHIPQNVSIVRVIYTPSWSSHKESVTAVNDQPANRYQVWTLVSTATSNVQTTIDVTKFGRGEGPTRQQAAGVSGQLIQVGF